MSKINQLEAVYGHLAIRANYFVTRLLRLDQYEFTPETFDHYTKSVGQATILQAEIDDHCDSLEHIAQACRHGLDATQPEHYHEFGYEFTGDPIEPELPYDPYTDILGYLAGGANISCLTLSPALLRFIELLPEVAAERAERNVEAKDGVLLYMEDDGSSRPMTRSELLRLGNRSVMDAAEQSLFATSYAEDMLCVQHLASTRGDLQQLLDLVDQA